MRQARAREESTVGAGGAPVVESSGPGEVSKPASVKAGIRRPLIIIVAVVAIVALVTGFVVWRNMGRGSDAGGGRTGSSSQPVAFDDSSPTAIVNTALQAGMQGDTDTMLRTLTSDEREDYSIGLASPSDYDASKTYKNLTVGAVKEKSEGRYQVNIIRGNDAERYRYVEVKQAANGGYRISDAGGLWVELKPMCNNGGYAPLGAYDYSCRLGGIELKPTQKTWFDKYGTSDKGANVVFKDAPRIVDGKKVRDAIVENLDVLKNGGDPDYRNFTYSNVGEPSLDCNQNTYTKIRDMVAVPVTVSYDDEPSGMHVESATMTSDVYDWYDFVHTGNGRRPNMTFNPIQSDD